MNTFSSINSIAVKNNREQVFLFPTLNSTALTTTSTSIQQAYMYQNVVLAISTAGGLMRRSADYGKTFSNVTNANFTGKVWKYVAIDQNQAIAISSTNVFTSNDSGATWTLRSPTSTNFTGGAIYNGLMFIADQANSRLYYSSDNGVNWRFQSISFPRGCAVTQNGSTYVVLVTGMTTSTSAIASFCRICTNFNPAVTTNTFVNTTYSGSVPFLVALDGQYAVCCSVGGGTNKKIKYSTNYGQTWTDISENITADCYAVRISGGYAIVATTYNTSYYTSNNNGQTWTSRTMADTATAATNYSNRATIYTQSGANTYCYYGVL